MPIHDQVCERLTVSLAKGETLIACHGRRPIAGWPHSGDHVHGALRAKLALPLLSQYQYQDDDRVLDVVVIEWSVCTSTRSALMCVIVCLVDVSRSIY